MVVVRRVRNPDVELQGPGRPGTEPLRPLSDPVRLVEHHPRGAHPTRLGDGDRKLGRAGTGHRRLQNREPKAVPVAEVLHISSHGPPP